MDAITALETVKRGIEKLHEEQRYEKDSTTKDGLLVAITYLRGQADLHLALKGSEELHKMLDAPEPTSDDPEVSDDDGVIDTQQTRTGTFEPVTQPQTNKRSRRE